MLHSTYPIVRPRCTTVPSAVSCACHTGRKKLIFNSTVAKNSPGPQRARKRYPHGGVSYVAQNSPMECSHRIRMLSSGGQYHRRPTVGNIPSFKANQTRDRYVVRLCPALKSGFDGIS